MKIHSLPRLISWASRSRWVIRVVLATGTHPLTGADVTLVVGSPPLVLQAGQSATCLYFDQHCAGPMLRLVKDGISRDLTGLELRGSTGTAYPGGHQPPPLTIAGPCTVSAFAAQNAVAYCTNSVTTFRVQDSTSGGSYLPANAVVIPADATGSFRIALESSADLVTWVEASPGIYGGGTSNRFFRVRMIKSP